MNEEKMTQAAEDKGEVAEGEICWVSHPIRQAHAKTALLVGVMVVTALALYDITSNAAWSVLSVFVLAIGVHDFLLPTEYHLNETGVESQVWFFRRHKPWSGLRSFYTDKNGVLLSPFPGRSRLEGFRGIYLRFDGNRERVMRFVRQQMTGGTR